MSIFPLAKRPAESYKDVPRNFGCARDGGKRKHAGCDLYAPVGTRILAVEDGEVIQGPYLFYAGTYALEVKHASGIVRYGEIRGAADGIKAGVSVKAGQVIATVGRLVGLSVSMLHFELFSAEAHGPLTVMHIPPFSRRSDLIDPTAFLDGCEEAAR